MNLNPLSLIETAIDKIWPDKNEAQKAKARLYELKAQGDFKEIDAAMNVIVAEAKSEHPLTSQWRPITMLVFVAIIANNYILAPYIELFFSVDVELEMPKDLWELLKIGLGGYVVGRSVEKSASIFKK